jgi:hypothetical protein
VYRQHEERDAAFHYLFSCIVETFNPGRAVTREPEAIAGPPAPGQVDQYLTSGFTPRIWTTDASPV